ncbi:hypothetical protein [Urechidicola vernalis]|uniref:Uncharacterized protein n=1 Tax=Urechidicola vernalis TaxID=3075600 RepID=A0ABU2Y1E5_9FLAO|nr:hypothetical protein [Urechidicola sp. P050]MDT0552033.1 hypothetical protein [Urechidicola sp. P050]
MKKMLLLAFVAFGFLMVSCDDDDDIVIVPNAGTIAGGPFTFIVDGTADYVSGITTDPNAVGTNSSFVITDDQGLILGLPPTLEALEGVNFDGAGTGICLIWYLRFEDDITGAEVGMNANDLGGTFDLSNSITVTRLGAPEAGTITGGPFTFIVDGTEDYVSGIATDPDAVGSNSSFVITDDQGVILGLPPTMADLEGVNFDGAGAGVCLIWYIRFEDDLTGAEVGMNANDLGGTFDLSNSIRVTRIAEPMAGTLSGGPFTFYIDGTPDYVTGVTPDANAVGTNSTFVITDDQGKILGLPPTMADLEGVNFDGAGTGTCLIWYLRFEDGLMGAEVGMNANDLDGIFSLSNSISVNRLAGPVAGTLSGGPFTFCVDGTVDNVSGISTDANAMGTNSTFVITDNTGKILGLPPTMADLEGVNFDGAGAGVCLIWYLRYEDGLTGAEVGMNANDLMGVFSLSNSIVVTRNMPEAGTLSGGPFTFTIDGTPDYISGITTDANAMGTNSTFVITDDTGEILGLPGTMADLEGVNFDGAGTGVCLIWYLRFEDGLMGAEVGMNANDLSGCFSLSNSITVTRN